MAASATAAQSRGVGAHCGAALAAAPAEGAAEGAAEAPAAATPALPIKKLAMTAKKTMQRINIPVLAMLRLGAK
jgi:hypothetical protein